MSGEFGGLLWTGGNNTRVNTCYAIGNRMFHKVGHPPAMTWGNKCKGNTTASSTTISFGGHLPMARAGVMAGSYRLDRSYLMGLVVGLHVMRHSWSRAKKGQSDQNNKGTQQFHHYSIDLVLQESNSYQYMLST